MLRIADLRIDYPDFHARYDLTAARGALCAIVGPSGGGKTTLLNAVAGFETARGGALTFDGVDLLPLPPGLRPCAMIFQDHNLFPHLSARDNVALALRPSLRLSPEERDAALDALRQVNLEGFAARLPSEMSGGQRQRVALARVLVSRKPLLLLDEPFGALDPGLRREMIALVDRLRRDKGLTVLMTIHTPEDALGAADQMVFVADGAVVASDEPSALLQQSSDARIAAFMGRSSGRS